MKPTLTPATFRSLSGAELAAAGLSLPLQALHADAQGDWDRAHELCQQGGTRDGDWVHAYLHRKEGDLGNAGYWYARAGRTMPDRGIPLDDEWTAIAAVLLGHGHEKAERYTKSTKDAKKGG
ncbi:hypothetical protein OPIT5_12285 [Opitutaceae bacterium TAV5]|nr:hypothetical protein OPIT5_12285 [Opitutaceae bacterium TAV5]